MLQALSKLSFRSLLLCAAVITTGCATSPKAPQGVLVEDRLLPEAEATPVRSEIAISRITEMLQSAALDKSQQAKLYYERGVMYDSVGLSVLARIDLIRALRLKPDMADAYNFIGIHHTMNAEYESAFEAFDSALELDPKYQYAYLNRGIALQYDDKLELAINDFKTFQSLQPNDPYRALWRYFAEFERDREQARAALASAQQGLDQQVWATQIVAFYLGQISEDELKAIAIEATDPKQLSEQLCELYFYLAKWQQMQNNPTDAAKYYKLALATNVFEFVEYRHARIELTRLRFSVLEDPSNAPAH